MELLPKKRRERGRQKRKQVRRTDHAVWSSERRQTSALELMKASMLDRVPSLIALKYARMAESPFGYFRGAVPVMAYDLSRLGNTGIESQLCGDAHVRNLGAFAGPDGRLVFDLNDFDETIRGPFEWDVKRMATSLMLAGRGTGEKEPYCRDAARVFVERYRLMMLEFARMPVLDMVRYQVHRLKSTVSVGGLLQLAERATPMHTLQQLTEVGTKPNGRSRDPEKRVFKSEPPVLTRLSGAEANKVIASLKTYEKSIEPQRRRFLEQYRPQDVAFKVVGTGSVGMRDYCIYLEGNGAKDPLFLQVKEETASAYAPYVAKNRNAPRHPGQRVVEGELAMQLQSDPFLGWTTLEGRPYLVRQLNDHKASIQVEDLRDTELLEYADVCGEILARGHARSGDCQELAGYLGGSRRFDDAVVQFAVAYADQTEKDWKELVEWRKKKLVSARTKSARKGTLRKR